MADIFKKAKRFEVMSKIKGNLSIELTLYKLFKKNQITSWRRHLRLPGRPGFAFTAKKVAVFVDGCGGVGIVAEVGR